MVAYPNRWWKKIFNSRDFLQKAERSLIPTLQQQRTQWNYTQSRKVSAFIFAEIDTPPVKSIPGRLTKDNLKIY